MKLFELNQAEKDRYFSEVKRECSNFIRLNDEPLWRGMSRDKGMTKVRIRTDRVPLNTTDGGNFLFNAYFEKQYGISFIRRKVAFVSTSYKQATDYGYPHAIFPINKTMVMYSCKVRDSFSLLDSLESMLKSPHILFKVGFVVNEHSKLFRKLTAFIYSLGYNTDLKGFYKAYNNKMAQLSGEAQDSGEVFKYPDVDNFLQYYFDFIDEMHYVVEPINDFKISSVPIEMEIGLFDAPYYYAIPEADIQGGHAYYKEYKKVKFG